MLHVTLHTSRFEAKLIESLVQLYMEEVRDVIILLTPA